MARIKGAIIINTKYCRGCSLYVVARSSDAPELHPRGVNNKGYRYVYMKNPDACIGCTSCGLVYSDDCLAIYRVGIQSYVKIWQKI